MADVNEEMVRLFFEQNEFLVRTNVKYYVKKNQGPGGDSDIDLVAYNLRADKMYDLNKFILSKQDLVGIRIAAIECKGWHEEVFSPAVLRNADRIFNFVRPEAIEKAKGVFQDNSFLRILIVPSLPENTDKRNESISIMKEKGIDHVIEFKTIMDDLFQSVEMNKNYNSPIQQTIRLVKKYCIHK